MGVKIVNKEVKESVVVSNVGNGSKQDNKGNLWYKFEITFENGDCANYSTTDQQDDFFAVGNKVEYELQTKEWQNFNGETRTWVDIAKKWIDAKNKDFNTLKAQNHNRINNDKKNNLISRLAVIKAASSLSYCKNMGETLDAAEQLLAWAEEQEPQVKNTNNKEGDDLPF
tara:strand:+ start:7572 stop:8081 length:510 start_codon:yes stop_codon:yes gene_type:complete